MKNFSPCTLIAATSLLFVSHFSIAETKPESDMEVINVTYRTPIEYALYEYTTETLALLRFEVTQQISLQARDQSMHMAENLGVFIETPFVSNGVNNHAAKLWLSQPPK